MLRDKVIAALDRLARVGTALRGPKIGPGSASPPPSPAGCSLAFAGSGYTLRQTKISPAAGVLTPLLSPDPRRWWLLVQFSAPVATDLLLPSDGLTSTISGSAGSLLDSTGRFVSNFRESGALVQSGFSVQVAVGESVYAVESLFTG